MLGMHIDGQPGRRLNLYATLWHFATEHYFVHPHLAVLLSDNQRIFRYHWSLRQGALVLNASVLIEDIPHQHERYRWNASNCTWTDGVRWSSESAFAPPTEIVWDPIPDWLTPARRAPAAK